MNISIIGSCHTRDIFNSKFISNYKEYFTLLSYFPRTSILSVMSKPVSYNYPRLMGSGLTELQMEKWYCEFEKPFLKTIVSQRPDFLLLDFYGDARYGACMYEGEYISNQVKQIAGKKIIKDNQITIKYDYTKNPDAFFMMWRNAADQFMDFMKRRLPGTRILINTVKGSKMISDQNGRVYPHPKLKKLDIGKLNELWEKMDRYVIEVHGASAIRYEKEYTLNEEYPFGLGIQLVHFHQEYYEDYFNKLLKLTEESKRVKRNKSYDINLLNRSIFDFGREECYQITGKFEKIEYPNYEALRPVDCRNELGDYRPQIWSKPVEIKGDGKTRLKLIFYVKMINPECLKEDDVVLTIRTFKGVKSKNFSDSISAFGITFGEYIKESDGYYKYEYEFCPKGKYIKIAPFLFNYVEGIEYSRFRLEYIGEADKTE